MKKAIIIFLLITAIVALWTFNNSFFHSNGGGSTNGTSAVIFAKADCLSVKIHVMILPKAGTWINISLPNGTQERVATLYQYDVLLPKTSGAYTNIFGKLPGNLTINNANLCGTVVVPNADDEVLSYLNSFSSDTVSVYWIKIDGNARVSVFSNGVGV
jgi:hypothetical protein